MVAIYSRLCCHQVACSVTMFAQLDPNKGIPVPGCGRQMAPLFPLSPSLAPRLLLLLLLSGGGLGCGLVLVSLREQTAPGGACSSCSHTAPAGSLQLPASHLSLVQHQLNLVEEQALLLGGACAVNLATSQCATLVTLQLHSRG